MNPATAHPRWRGKEPVSRRTARRKHAAIVASAALAASAMSALPATATIGDAGVDEGSNITTFHNIDFIAAFGYGPNVGDEVTIEVFRNDVLIGTATGPTVDAEGLPGLEVNHGPAGPAQPGDCWEGNTPDILPGDLVRVTDNGGADVDEVIVDDIRFTGGPTEQSNGNITVPFVARRASGAAIPASFIDSPEFRAETNNQLRFEPPNVLVRPQPGGAPGEYNMVYPSPFTPSRNRDNFTQRQIREALLGDGHAIGFGHTEVLPLESMLHDGLTDVPGPALGCEASPSARWAVTDVTPASLNLANQDRGLTVRGVSHDSSAVQVNLADGSGPAVTKEATLAANGNWTASFTPAELTSLDGDVTVSGAYSLPDGNITGSTMTLMKDLVRPDAPSLSEPAGAYDRARSVRLNAAPGEAIRYTLGNGRQARPTAKRGTLYERAIRITSTQVLKAVAIDEAGNVSPVSRARYRITKAPSRPRLRQALSGRSGGRDTAIARWRGPSAGSADATGYRVTALRMRRNGSVAQRSNSAVLRPGKRRYQMRLRRGRYTFQVRAYNEFGRSRLSSQSNAVRSR